MGIRAGSMAAAGLLLMAALAAAQTPEPPVPAPPAESVDVSRLPVDIDRIGRKLQQARAQGRGLYFSIEVFAEAPPLLLFTPQDNLRWGPVPYGTPLHQEMMNVITPQQFRSPMMDFSSLLRWLNDQRRRDREQQR